MASTLRYTIDLIKMGQLLPIAVRPVVGLGLYYGRSARRLPGGETSIWQRPKSEDREELLLPEIER